MPVAEKALKPLDIRPMAALLAEYCPKLEKCLEQFHAATTKRDKEAITRRYQRIEPALVELVRQVSPMVEHGRLRPFDRTELWLRLAEFESLLEQFKIAGLSGPSY